MHEVELSIVFPALNEERKIARDVEAAGQFLGRNGIGGEVIVVDDGSTDHTADAAESAVLPDEVPLTVIRHERNHGKGCAVRTGMLRTRGRYAMFADSGLCVPFDDGLRGLELLKAGVCELAHGSRLLPGSCVTRRQPLYRRTIGRAFRALAPLLTGTPRTLTDTQCGFKLYRGEVARELFARCTTDGFLFDVEVILRAVRAGLRIQEFPIHWRSDPDTRLRPLRAAPRMLRELIALRRALASE